MNAIPRGVWALGFVSLLMDVSSELIHSLLPIYIVTVLGASALMLGLIEGAAEATALIVKVFSGTLSDLWRRRKPLVVAGYGLGALSKPLFALATSVSWVFAARFMDRIGKGIRGAPRDALIADLTPPQIRGAAFGLRQSLDTVGALLGPVLAIGLMMAWSGDFRAVFAVAAVPAFAAVALLMGAVQEPARRDGGTPAPKLDWTLLQQLPPGFWGVVVVGAGFSLARFSEAFLILGASTAGLDVTLTPLVLIVMNAVYAVSAYPFGKLSDSVSHGSLLAIGIGLLVAADLMLAGGGGVWLWGGVALWGLHMGATQGLLARMIADSTPDALRGTAFGLFNLVAGACLLVASALAGAIWDAYGSGAAFLTGAGIAGSTLALVLFRYSFAATP